MIVSARASFAKCRDQPTAFFLRRSSKLRWCHGHRSIGCGGLGRRAGTACMARASVSMERPSRSGTPGTFEGTRSLRLTALTGTFGGVARTLEGTGPSTE